MAKTSRQVEVERKYDVTDSAVSPSFEGLSAVGRIEQLSAQTLDAVYFDTAGHDLAANHVTLRMRTGGTDEGWHLKLPAGPDARTEIHAPLGAAGGTGDDAAEHDAAEHDNVPAELHDVVLAIVRDRPLAPVARITTTRNIQLLYAADGSQIAEFCDDHVTAWAAEDGSEQQWREWELELMGVTGDEITADAELLDRLGNRLFDAGAVPAGHGSKLARVMDTAKQDPDAQDTSDAAQTAAIDPVHRAVTEQVKELLVWDRAVRADAYDSVHQMRVTTRKIRSLLQASEESFGLTDDAWILDELRQLASVLGVARDAEVLAERYEKALDGLPTELVRGQVRERLVDGAKRRYDAGLRRSLIAMRSARYFRLLDALDRLVDIVPTAVAGEEPAPVTIDAAYKRVRKAAKAAAQAGGADRDEALHRIRKGAKRLRYTAAATGDTKVSERAKTIQTLLGDHQDSVVSRTHLSQQAEAAYAAGEDTFTYGLLYQREDDLANSCREQLDDALGKLKASVQKAQQGSQ